MNMITMCKSQNPEFCSHHYTLAIKQKLDYAKTLYRQAKGRSAVIEAQKDVERLTRLYNSTPEGIKKIISNIAEEKIEKKNNYPLLLQEKLRIAKLDAEYRKAEYFIKTFEQNNKKIQPEQINTLFTKTKYKLKNTTNSKNYLELYDTSKEYNSNNVIATLKKTKGGWLITSKATLNEPNNFSQIIGSTDGIFGDIIAVKKTLISLRREIEKRKQYYNHSKQILGDTRKYGLLVLSKTIMFNRVPQKHYIIYSSKSIPFAIYRVDNENNFIEGHTALNGEKTELITDAWTFREWIYNYQNTERRLPSFIVE
jgi:hypothetical protein